MGLKHFIIAILAVMAVSCSNEETINTSENLEGNAFVQFAIAMPSNNTTSRAFAPGDGTEEGTEAEWTATNILVVLYSKTDNSIVASKMFGTSDFTKTENTSAKTKIYTTNTWQVKSGEYKMFAIVNPVSENIPTYTELTSGTRTADADFVKMTTANKFTMTNATDGFIASDPTTHNSYYNDGAMLVKINGTATTPTQAQVKVERSVAKVMLTDKADGTDYIYTPTGTGCENHRVVFEGYLKSNLNKSYYPVKHVIQSTDVNNDYVVDPNFYASVNSTVTYVTDNFSNIAIRPTTLNPLQSLKVNSTFYCLENTMNADNAGNVQEVGQTTLVVYQARYYVNANDDANAVVANAKHIYKYLGKAFTSFTDLIAAGAEIPAGITEKTFDNKPANNYNIKEINDMAVKGITVYNGGVCYYMYKIKHKPSDVNNDVMEFAVVRNNVYKLKINSVAGIGKGSNEDIPTVNPDPTDPTKPNPTDPEPTPKDPTEMDDTDSNLNVEVSILPWTIRTNNIDL